MIISYSFNLKCILFFHKRNPTAFAIYISYMKIQMFLSVGIFRFWSYSSFKKVYEFYGEK